MNTLTSTGVKTPEDDAFWVDKARDGETTGWAELHRRYYPKLWSAVNQVVEDAALAEDVVQEAFIKASRQIHRFRGNSKFSTWLYRIAMNQSFDALRKRNRRQKWLGFFSLDDGENSTTLDVAAPEPNLSQTERADHREALAKALAALTPEHRAVVELRLVQGLTTEEAAKALGCRKGTILSRLFYACRKLQTLLKKNHEEL